MTSDHEKHACSHIIVENPFYIIICCALIPLMFYLRAFVIPPAESPGHLHLAAQLNNANGPPLPRKLYLISQPGKEAYMRFALEGIRRTASALGYHGDIEV